MANPVLVEVSRDPEGGRFVESRHRGSIAIVDRSGALVFAAGDVARQICPRSAFKSMQALPMLEVGAVQAYDLGSEEIALACASHGGQAKHVEKVRDWLERIECTVADLECGPHLPSHVASAHEMIGQGETPTALHNNCSGKHTGFLTLAKLMNAPTKGYTDYDHPVQVRVREVISDLVGVNIADFPVGRDGCHAPNYQMPLEALALGMSRIANPQFLPPHRRRAAEVLIDAVSEVPFYMAGDERACTVLTQHLAQVGFVKVGAEGVFAGCLPSLGFGVAIKIDDGAVRAAEVAITTLLARLDQFAHPDQLTDRLKVPVRNTRGLTVGFITPSPEWETFDLPKP